MTSPGVWDFSPAGFPAGAVTFTGTVLFPAGLDPSQTKTAVIVLGPGGGQITVPPLAQGESGLSPILTFGTPTTLPAGSAATATVTQTAEGSAGVAAAYNIVFGIPEGAAGPAFQTEIVSASDLSGTPAAGFTIVFVPAQGDTPAEFAYAAQPYQSVFNAINIPDTPDTAGGNRPLDQVSIPAQPFIWTPDIKAQTTFTGTDNTNPALVARLNNGQSGAFSGTQVGFGLGTLGPEVETVTAIQSYDVAMSGSEGGGVIAANVEVTILLNAEEQADTTDQYATSNTIFTVNVQPLGIISTAQVSVDVVDAGVAVVNNTGSFTHTIGANDNYVLIAFAGAADQNVLLEGLTVTYGGVSVPFLGATQASGDAFIALFGLQTPPSGAQTVTVTGASGGSGVTSLVAVGISFGNQNQTSGVLSTGGDSTSITADPISLGVGQIEICAFVSLGTDAITPTSAAGNTLFSHTGTSSVPISLLVQSANGTGGVVTLTADTAAAQPWAAAALTLI
jgi:hypothetical protein